MIHLTCHHLLAFAVEGLVFGTVFMALYRRVSGRVSGWARRCFATPFSCNMFLMQDGAWFWKLRLHRGTLLSCYRCCTCAPKRAHAEERALVWPRGCRLTPQDYLWLARVYASNVAPLT